MLRAMRGAAETWVIKVLMVLLVVSFSIWGVGDVLRGNPQQRLVACIGGIYLPLSWLFGYSGSICTGERVTVQEVMADFQRIVTEERGRRGVAFTPAVAAQEGMLEQVIHAVTARTLFDRLATEFGLKYDQQAVLAQLAKMPELRTKDGAFDQANFRRIVSNLQMSEAEFLASMRLEQSRNQLLSFFTTAAVAPKLVSESLIQAATQQTMIEVLQINHATLPVPTTPDSKVLETFKTERAAQFTAPELRAITVLPLLQQDLAMQISVSDSDIATAFTKRVSEFSKPERRDIVQVVVADEATAQALAATAQKSGNLQQAATTAKQEAMLLEDQEQEALPAPLASAIFKASAKAILPPIKTDFGFHVVQVLAIKPAHTPSLAEARDQIKATLQREQAQERVQELANRADDALAAGKTLADIGGDLQIKPLNFAMLDANGADAAGKMVAMPDGTSNVIRQSAFALNDGETSSLLDDQRGNYFIVRVDSITPPRLRSLEETKPKLIAAWQAQQQDNAAKTAAEELKTAWQEQPQGFATLAKRPIISKSRTVMASLASGGNEALPAIVQQQMLQEKSVGHIVVANDANAHYVARLAGFRAGDSKLQENFAATTQPVIKRAWQNDVIEQLDNALRTQQSVHLHEATISSLRQSLLARAEN